VSTHILIFVLCNFWQWRLATETEEQRLAVFVSGLAAKRVSPCNAKIATGIRAKPFLPLGKLVKSLASAARILAGLPF
jgi:hypothetical protein